METLHEIVLSCIEQIRVAPKLIIPYADMLSKGSPFTPKEIREALEQELDSQVLSADYVESNKSNPLNKSLNKKPLVYVNKELDIPKLSGMKWGLSRNKHERKMFMVTEMRSHIYSSKYGISKTELLKRMRKDNSHWRPLLTSWLDEMVMDKLLKKEGHRYFSPQISLETRERRLHRLVFESLENESLSITTIARKVGYGGGDNRKIVRTVIEDLQNDGYIKCLGVKWCWMR
jgi:hypothetical protein